MAERDTGSYDLVNDKVAEVGLEQGPVRDQLREFLFKTPG